MTDSTNGAAQIFKMVGALFADPVFLKALPVIHDVVVKINGNPVRAAQHGAQFVADLAATLPVIDAAAVHAAAELFRTMHEAALGNVTPTMMAPTPTQAVTPTTPAPPAYLPASQTIAAAKAAQEAVANKAASLTTPLPLSAGGAGQNMTQPDTLSGPVVQ